MGEDRDAGLADHTGEVHNIADVALLLLLAAGYRYGSTEVEGQAAHQHRHLHRWTGRDGRTGEIVVGGGGGLTCACSEFLAATARVTCRRH